MKYRAWNKSKRKMIPDYAHFDKQGKLVTVPTFPEDEYIPLLYSGLKDRYGKVIAEGDVVKDKFELLCEVRFGEFGDTKYHIQYGFYLYNSEDKISLGNMGYNADERCPLEVIGTIYENQELLAT